MSDSVLLACHVLKVEMTWVSTKDFVFHTDRILCYIRLFNVLPLCLLLQFTETTS